MKDYILLTAEETDMTTGIDDYFFYIEYYLPITNPISDIVLFILVLPISLN